MPFSFPSPFPKKGLAGSHKKGRRLDKVTDEQKKKCESCCCLRTELKVLVYLKL